MKKFLLNNNGLKKNVHLVLFVKLYLSQKQKLIRYMFLIAHIENNNSCKLYEKDKFTITFLTF